MVPEVLLVALSDEKWLLVIGLVKGMKVFLVIIEALIEGLPVIHFWDVRTLRKSPNSSSNCPLDDLSDHGE